MHIKSTESRPERRQGLRIAQDRPIKVLEPHLNKYIGGKTHDSSLTGLRIELPSSAPLMVGRLVNLAMGNYQSGGLARNREMIPAKVVWIDRNGMAPGRMMAGIQFVESAAMAVSAA